MILLFKLIFTVQLFNGIEIFVQDKVAQTPIPYAQLSICGKTYEADQKGKITIESSDGICDFIAFAFEYNTLEGKIALKGKRSLVFRLDPKVIDMRIFTIEAEKIEGQNGKEIVAQAIKNFSNTHTKSFDGLTLEDSISFSLGNEEFLKEIKKFNFVLKESKLTENWAKRSVVRNDIYGKLENLISNPFGGPVNQKIIEYSTNRTDILMRQNCDYFKNLDCYLAAFFSSQRAIALNPFFSRPVQSQKLDHYGFFNEDFLDSHKFKLIGLDTLGGRPSYVVEISDSRKSKPISLGGGGITEWYRPSGTLWIDEQDLALVRMSYRYEYLSKPKFLSAAVNKAEYESGSVFYENILEYKKVDGTYVPYRQYTNEKDRNLRIFYNDTFFEPVYAQHFIKFTLR